MLGGQHLLALLWKRCKEQKRCFNDKLARHSTLIAPPLPWKGRGSELFSQGYRAERILISDLVIFGFLLDS